MPLEALWVSQNRTDSASDGIDGGTGCNFIFFNIKYSSCVAVFTKNTWYLSTKYILKY